MRAIEVLQLAADQDQAPQSEVWKRIAAHRASLERLQSTALPVAIADQSPMAQKVDRSSELSVDRRSGILPE